MENNLRVTLNSLPASAKIMYRTLSTILTLLLSLPVALADTLPTVKLSTVVFPTCGVQFSYPSWLRITQNRKPQSEGAVCEFLVWDPKQKHARYELLRVTVLARPLNEALVLGGWEYREEIGNGNWVYPNYGIGHAEKTQAADRTIITTSSSFKCNDEGPGTAVACDAQQGAVSNGKITILVNSNQAGDLYDATYVFVNSLRFLGTFGPKPSLPLTPKNKN